MIKDTRLLREFEREYTARLDAELPYEQALRIYESLWQEALKLGAIDDKNPLVGVEADIKMARTLNALR